MKFSIKLMGALTSKPYAFSARSWELESLDFIDFYDSTLSTIRIDVRGLSIMRVLPRINEKLNEEWISDKIRFSYDSFRRQRLMNPLIKLDNSLISVDWEESFFFFFFKYNLRCYSILNTNVNLLGLLGKFVDLESILMFKEYLSSFKDLSSKLFLSERTNVSNSLINNFLLNTDISSISKSDCIILLGSNLRYTHPVLHIKLLRLSNQGVPVFTFAVPSSIKAKVYSFGFSAKNLIKFLEGKNRYSLLLSKSKNPLFLLGDSISKRLDFSIYSYVINFANKLKISVGSLLSNPTELAFLSLGLSSSNLNFSNDYNFVYNYNSDNNNLLALKNNFVIYQGHHGDTGAVSSDIIYPSTFLLEKSGTFVNLEGKFINYNYIIKPSNLIRTDWRIFKALTLYFNSNLNYTLNSLKDIRSLLLKKLPSYSLGFMPKNSLIIKDDGLFFRIGNTPLISVYNNYYMTDQVSRSSRVMALTLMKFKNNFLNF